MSVNAVSGIVFGGRFPKSGKKSQCVLALIGNQPASVGGDDFDRAYRASSLPIVRRLCRRRGHSRRWRRTPRTCLAFVCTTRVAIIANVNVSRLRLLPSPCGLSKVFAQTLVLWEQVAPGLYCNTVRSHRGGEFRGRRVRCGVDGRWGCARGGARASRRAGDAHRRRPPRTPAGAAC